jgi:hypothetical protein
MRHLPQCSSGHESRGILETYKQKLKAVFPQRYRKLYVADEVKFESFIMEDLSSPFPKFS